MRSSILIFALYFVASHESFGQSPAAAGSVITIAGNGLVDFSGDGGPATNAALNQILGLAFGPDGTLFVADSNNYRVRAIDPATGIIRTIAGTGVPGDQGDGGPAITATIGEVIGMATDKARNALYLTDWGNNYVRKVNLNDGVITRYAGGGFGFSGDGGPAIFAEFLSPVGAATDAAGRFSVLDMANRRIRRVDPITGVITTIGGSGVGAPLSGPTGDGGPATSATFGNEYGLTADSAGNIFFRDGDPSVTYHTIRRIDAATGIIVTIAGGGANPPGTGVATTMKFTNIVEVAAGNAGELFVATPYQVFKLNIATGIIAPFAGDGTRGLGNEGDPALSAKFNNITAIAVAPDGGLAIGDTDNSRIRLVTPQPKQPATSSGRVIAIAGNGTVGFSGDGGPAISGSLNVVQGLAFGGDGTLYMSDTGNLRIRAVDPLIGNIRTIAGTGAVGDEGNGGPATNANLTTVIGLATDRSRNALYFPEYGNFWVRKINLTNGIISLYAGTGVPGPSGDGGLATASRLRRPISAATDALGRLYFSDYVSSRVRTVDPVSGILNTIAGNGVVGEPSGDGAPGTSATLGSPMRLTADPAGNVYLRDGDPNGTYYVVRRIDATTGIITTIVGGGTNAPGVGVATSMFFDNISEVAANDAGELFVATPVQVFKLNIATGIIAPFAGDGISGPTTNGIPALTARFANITALAVAPGGGLVVSDEASARVYYIAPESISLTGDSGQTSFTLPWVSALTGDLVLENTSATAISLSELGTVAGEINISENTAATVINLGSLEGAGSINIAANTSAATISLGELGAVAGEVNISENTAASVISLGSLEGAGSVDIDANTSAATISLSELGEVAGEVNISENTSASEVDLGSLTSAGSVTITDNTSATVINIGSLTNATGEVTIEDNGTNTVVHLDNLTEYGCGTNDVTMTLEASMVTMTNSLTLCTNATLVGSATVDGSVTNNGTMEPGSSPGRLSITRNLHLGATSRLNLEVGGFAQGEFDTVNVGGNTTLGGSLTIRLLDRFVTSMTNGASFTVLTSGQPLTGEFANVASGGTLTAADGRGRFTVRYAGVRELRLTDFEILPGGAELRIISVEKQSNGLRISWNSVGGQSYRVEFTSNLDRPFAGQSPVITALGSGESTLHFDSNVSAESTSGFYRVRLVE